MIIGEEAVVTHDRQDRKCGYFGYFCGCPVCLYLLRHDYRVGSFFPSLAE